MRKMKETDDGILMTEEEFQERLNRSHQSGISAGWSDAGAFLMEDAAKWFRAGKDSEADILRTLARAMLDQAKKLHPGAGGS
jgi:hypothetical protein